MKSEHLWALVDDLDDIAGDVPAFVAQALLADLRELIAARNPTEARERFAGQSMIGILSRKDPDLSIATCVNNAHWAVANADALIAALAAEEPSE